MATTREAFHALVDDLNEGEAELFYRMVRQRREDPFLRALAEAPLDDEPSTPEEEAGVREAMEDYRRGDLVDIDDLKRELGLES